MLFNSYEEMVLARENHLRMCSNWIAGYDCMHTEDWDYPPANHDLMKEDERP